MASNATAGFLSVIRKTSTWLQHSIDPSYSMLDGALGLDFELKR
jgi:hypothetical protein